MAVVSGAAGRTGSWRACGPVESEPPDRDGRVQSPYGGSDGCTPPRTDGDTARPVASAGPAAAGRAASAQGRAGAGAAAAAAKDDGRSASRRSGSGVAGADGV